MKEIDILFGKKPFSLSKEVQRKYFLKILNKLYLHHKKNSIIFKKIDNIFSYTKTNINLSNFPFIPVSLFKKYELKSLPDNKIHKVLKAPHPSPLSAYRGFFGCKHFSSINKILKENGFAEINWKLE